MLASICAEETRVPDPQLSTAKRLARKTTLNTHLSQSALDRELAALRSSHAALEAKLKDRDVQITRLEKDNEYLTSREAEEQEEREREVGEMQGRLENVEEELRNVRRLVAEVEGERDDALDERDALERAKEGTVADLQAQVDTMTGQVEHYQSELSECHAQAEANGRLVQSLREQVDTLTEERGRLVGSRNDDAGARVVREELARQTKYIRNLESKNLKLTSEVTSLRERMMSVEVLREEKRAMEKKLGQLDAMRARTVELEAQLEAAEKERKNWCVCRFWSCYSYSCLGLQGVQSGYGLRACSRRTGGSAITARYAARGARRRLCPAQPAHYCSSGRRAARIRVQRFGSRPQEPD